MVLASEGNEAQAQAAQRRCGCPTSSNAQGQAGGDFGHWAMGGDPTHGEIGDGWALSVQCLFQYWEEKYFPETSRRRKEE